MYDNQVDVSLTPPERWRRGALICGCIATAAGLAVGILRYGGGPAGGGWGMDDHVGGSIAIGAAIAGTGVVALVARRGRPLLLVAAGLALMPMCVISVVLFPMMFLALGMVVSAASAPPPRFPREPLRTALTIALVAALQVAAMVALIAHPDARTITRPSMVSSTSDVITWFEVTVSLCGTFLAIVVACTMPPEEPRLLGLPPPPRPAWTPAN
jgi:hypothetical protein